MSDSAPPADGRSALRVLMTTDAVGGVFGYSVDLCRAICDAGGQVVLVTMGPRPDREQRAQLAGLPGVELITSNFKLEWMDEAAADVARAGLFLQQLAESYRPHVVHLNGYAHAALPFPAPTVVVAHSCVLSWWRAVQGCDAPARYGEYRRLVREGLRAADVVVAPSRTMLRVLRQHYLRDLHGLVIHNAAPSTGTLPSAPRERNGVFSAGRVWDPAKNVALVLAAAQRSQLRFRIAGALTEPGSRIEHALGTLPTNVELLGALPRAQVGRLMAESAFYVHPARYEPFGLSILEAAQAGCALVLADIPSLRELWQGAASFVPVDDADALVRSLEELSALPALRQTMAGRAQERAARFGYGAFADRYLALYDGLRATWGAPNTTRGTDPCARPARAQA